MSRMLKIMAKELNVPVICLSQLSRANEKRDDKRPMLSDLRESGAIEQDADIVLFLYRDDYYNEDSEKQNIAECIVAKNRHGETGKVELRWMPEYTTFSTLDNGMTRTSELAALRVQSVCRANLERGFLCVRQRPPGCRAGGVRRAGLHMCLLHLAGPRPGGRRAGQSS